MSNPLLDGPPAEIRLSGAPLVHVLGVVRFSPVMKIVDTNGAGIVDFQERVRRDYPVLKQEQEHAFQFQISEQGPLAPLLVSQPVWRFLDKTQNWRVSLTRESLGLETQTAYVDRAAFLARLVDLCSAVQATYEPAECVSLGVRYVNVLAGERLNRLSEFVAPEFLAFGQKPFIESLISSNHASEFNVPEGRLVVRFGLLAPGQVHDPQVLEPAQERRYFLDIDAMTTKALDFATDEMQSRVRALTERIYTIFRSAVTPALLESCNAA